MTDRQPDLIIRAGRVFCADAGLDGSGAVAVWDGRITASGPDVSGEARETLEFSDGVLLPGFVDLHAHPAPMAWRFGIDGDSEILPQGATTVLSQGDAGAETWSVYLATIIEPSRLRVRLAMSPAVKGEYEDRGCFVNLSEVDMDACVAAIEKSGEHIWGVAANLTAKACGDNDPREIMRRTVAIAERTGKPILYGVRREPSDWPLADQLKVLRAGDVFTYCFHSDAESVVDGGRIVDPFGRRGSTASSSMRATVRAAPTWAWARTR
jgi:dihydroorotase